MNLLLIILKYAGTAISGIAGIWGTVSETRDKKGRLTKWGRWALRFAIAGFVVALGSQIAEQIIATDDRTEAKQKAKENEDRLKDQLDTAHEQLDLAQQQLILTKSSANSIEGERTRFDKIEVRTIFELPSSDPTVKELVEQLHRVAAAHTTVHENETNNPHLIPHLNGLVVVGADYVNEPDCVEKLPALLKLRSFCMNMRGNPLTLVINKQRRSPVELRHGLISRTNNDLLISNESKKLLHTMFYSDRTRRIFFDLNFSSDATNGNWVSNSKVVGISDLTKSQFVLVCDWPDKTNSSEMQFCTALQPVWAGVNLGDKRFSINQFTNFFGTWDANRLKDFPPDIAVSFYYEAQLPDADLILSDNAYKSPPPNPITDLVP